LCFYTYFAVSVCSTKTLIHTSIYSIYIYSVPLVTELGISLIILPLMRIMQRNLKRTTDTFLFISHTTNVLLFKFRCNIFIGDRIIKEMPGLVASGHTAYNSVALVRTRTIPTERPPPVGEVSANFCG